MRRFAQSPAFVRTRAVTGVFFAVFGVAIVIRTVVAVGARPQIVPGIVMGLALIGLGTMRIRAYVEMRRSSVR